jgi:hypothetical protein
MVYISPNIFILSLVGRVLGLAFDGAVGFGAIATGGNSGTTVHVTNLLDSGSGSFRDAVSQSNRNIVFDSTEIGGVFIQ